MTLSNEPYKANFASASVALNGQFFQRFAIHPSVHDCVDVFGLIFRRYHHATVGAWEITVTVNSCQVNREYLRICLFHLVQRPVRRSTFLVCVLPYLL